MQAPRDIAAAHLVAQVLYIVFDKQVEMTPKIPDRAFWQEAYRVALDDLAKLIALANLVLCEGNQAAAANSFDAYCYNQLFADTHPDTLFISKGGSKEVEQSEGLIAVLKSVAGGAEIWRLIDRDDMTPDARQERIKEGIRVLGRREIENYLYDPDVLRVFLKMINKEQIADIIIDQRNALLLTDQASGDNVKAISRELFDYIKKKHVKVI